jgi:hypothetical protein
MRQKSPAGRNHDVTRRSDRDPESESESDEGSRNCDNCGKWTVLNRV